MVASVSLSALSSCFFISECFGETWAGTVFLVFFVGYSQYENSCLFENETLYF